jgi:predicted NBD/HSP70 family sugar kinase
MTYVLFDIGGTKTRVALSEDLTTLGASTSYKTPQDFKEGIAKLAEAAASLGEGEPLRGACGGIRGILNDDRTGIVYDSVLEDWIDQPIAAALKKKLKTEVILENDAALAGLGEAHFGAGEGFEIIAYHTVSTGVGGVKIEDGKIDDHRNGFEPGRQVLDIDQTILGEGIEPTLENLVSGTAVEERMGVKPYEIPQSDAIWDQLALYLAHGLRNTILYWSPDAIVLGGSMIVGDPRIPLDAIIRHTNEVVGEAIECPLIVDARLGDTGGLYGAMALLSERM